MSPTRPFIWLASYPKSGNTWVRALLTAYFGPDTSAIELDALGSGSFTRRRTLFDNLTGITSADLRPDEIDRLRPAFHRLAAEHVVAPSFVKLHERWSRNADGEPVFPADVSLGVVYLVRNPLDVAASYAAHCGDPIDTSIAWMADRKATFDRGSDRISTRFVEPLGSWSDNVSSWLDQRDMPVLLVRYEDMLTDCTDAFSRILRFAGVDPDPGRVAASVRSAGFERLRDQEEKFGFRERASRQERFFRAGIAGGWRTELTPGQAARIVREHGPTMRSLGYGADADAALARFPQSRTTPGVI